MVLQCRLSHLCSLVVFLFLLLPGLVLAQAPERVPSKEIDFRKWEERGWEENIDSQRGRLLDQGDVIRDEHFRLKSEAHGIFHDKLRAEMPVTGISAIKPVAHMSVNICDRTAVVMDAILSRISATNNCSEVTSTQLAAITGTLNLSFQNISSLKAGDFDGLISLGGLDLYDNDLVTLPDGIFDELTSLTELFLSGNDLVTLPDGIFDELTSLTELFLSGNDLVTLPDGIFDPLTSLTELFLSRNDLVTLPDGIFDPLTSLTLLSLGDNAFSTLPNGIFDPLTSLTWLSLGGNALSTLPDGIFDPLTSLTRLGLGGNALSALPDGIFDPLTSLTTLYLYHNDLVTLPDGIFDPLTSLTYLSLTSNDLAALPNGIFDPLTSLTVLGLGGNALSTLPDGIFDELTLLGELYLWGSDLVTLPDGIFDALTSLTWLELSDNDLVMLPDGIFDELTSLTVLYLWGNDLVTLPDGIFDELTSLTWLALWNNDLVTLPDGIFENLAELSLVATDLDAGLSIQRNPGAPFRPVVNAGADLTVQPGTTVSVFGNATGPWGDFVRWEWIQVDGPNSDTPISGALPLTGGDTDMPSFTAPMAEGELHFKLVAAPGHKGEPTVDYGHAYSHPDWVTITISDTPTNTSDVPLVVDFNLLGNYPNPFNPSTTILLDLPEMAAVSVDMFNMLGQRVHREDFPVVAAGPSKALPLEMSHLSSGAYVYQVTARMGKEVHRASGRMTLIK